MKNKILIIEDEKILAEMYKEKFEAEGFDVFLAFDSQEGLEVAKKEKPELILLDILLPSENGVYLLQKIKKDNNISKIPVIAFSNYDDQKTKNEAMELGAIDYIIKANHTPQEIIEKIKNYLKK